MREIEILVKILEPKKSALKKLSRFKKKGTILLHDEYYYHPANKSMLPGKKGFTEFFRLRREGKHSYLTYKKDIFDGKQWLYSDEYETEISNPEQMELIIEHLKLKRLIPVINRRTYYYHKNYEIVLEEVKGLGLFLEIERLDPEDSESARQIRKDIFKLLKETGIRVSEECNMGKEEQLIRKKKPKIKPFLSS